MKVKLVLLLFLAIIPLASLSCGFPRIIRTVTLDATLVSITYLDSNTGSAHDRLLYASNALFSNVFRPDDPIRATSEQVTSLVVGHPYRFVIEVWTDGWGNYYILKDATSLRQDYYREK